MTFRQAILFSLLQGTTELAPVSSLGHGVLLPLFAGWSGVARNPQFLPFMVALHLGTALALLLFFWKDWWALIQGSLVWSGLLPSGQDREESMRNGRTMGLLVVGTVPAAILGFLLEKKIRLLFSSPAVAAFFLGINGIVLILAEYLRKRQISGDLAEMKMSRALIVGSFQAMALIPGLSRSGITMVGGLLNGLGHEEAARFSFLLSTPIIVGAGVLELPKLIRHGSLSMLHLALVGGFVSFLAAFSTTFLLMRYFRSYETGKALVPFGWYCLMLSAVAGGWMIFH